MARMYAEIFRPGRSAGAVVTSEKVSVHRDCFYFSGAAFSAWAGAKGAKLGQGGQRFYVVGPLEKRCFYWGFKGVLGKGAKVAKLGGGGWPAGQPEGSFE